MNLFRHPEFMAIAAALIAVPIIIHLINRLRFKRIRWAAMEFLLKAQKKNRRRLIIEQLLLLALRCFLVMLVGVLVMRFVGVSFADLGMKHQVHVVLLDDSLSMNDQWKKQDTDEKFVTCFQVAKNDILLEKIAPKLRQSSSTDQLVILPLSQAGEDKPLKVYDKLTETARFEELKRDLAAMQKPTLLHLRLSDGIKRAAREVRKLKTDDNSTIVTLHVLSDFRQKDWAGDEGGPLHKEVLDFVNEFKAKVYLIDATYPARVVTQAQAPPARGNVGIVDLKPRSRVVGKDVPVTFTITLANFGDSDVEQVFVDIFDHADGKKRDEIDFSPVLPLKLKKGLTQVTFEARFSPELKPGQAHFAAISAHLRGEFLSKDGLPQDNVAYGVVEVRDQVPILIVDGEGGARQEEGAKGGDSFFLNQALISVPSAGSREGGVRPPPPFRVDLGSEMASGVAMKALERADLRQYPSINLCNVPRLDSKQLENLEKYVQDGGGVCFFMGPLVSPNWYNDKLWKKGEGLFPVKLKEPYHPGPGQKKLETEYIKGVPMLLLHDEIHPFPIFGPIVKDPLQRSFLDHLPVYRYFQVDGPTGKAVVLASLPGEQKIDEQYQKPVLNIVREKEKDKDSKLVDLFEKKPEFGKYASAFQPFRVKLTGYVEPGSQTKPFYLALELERMLKAKGKDANGKDYDLEKFWDNVDVEVQSLATQIKDLIRQIRYGAGAPFVLTSTYGKGKVVVVMSTAGKAWNEWAGGSKASVLYEPFIWEIQNYLSAQSVDTNLTLGTPLAHVIDVEPYVTPKRSTFKMFRAQLPLSKGNLLVRVPDDGQTGERQEGQITFRYPVTAEPGVYVADLVDAEDDKKVPLVSRVSVFNLATEREGPLERVATDHIVQNLVKNDKAYNDKREPMISFEGMEVNQESLGGLQLSDFSQSPLLFLIFVFLMVLEQALAVHLSFHLRGNENQILNPADVPQRSAA